MIAGLAVTRGRRRATGMRMTPDLSTRERKMLRSAALALLILVFLLPLLGACGKRGAPSPPGPANEITYPKVYPSE